MDGTSACPRVQNFQRLGGSCDGRTDGYDESQTLSVHLLESKQENFNIKEWTIWWDKITTEEKKTDLSSYDKVRYVVITNSKLLNVRLQSTFYNNI